MISICIPVYNIDPSYLVQSIVKQCIKENIIYEVIIIDDASSKLNTDHFSSLKELENTRFIALNTNIGRAKIRNLFLNYCSYDYLLFIDGDLYLNSESFINRYIKEINKEKKVVCGGITYTKHPPKKENILRWKNTKNKESHNAKVRIKKPYASFMTGCFLIKRNVLELSKFNEKIKGYGHEDTLFGYNLMKHDFIVTHIDNPVLVKEYDTNKEFIIKSEKAIQNLNSILKISHYDVELINLIKVLKTLQDNILLQSNFIKKYNHYFIPILKKVCCVSFMPLFFFDLLKLSYAIKYITIKK